MNQAFVAIRFTGYTLQQAADFLAENKLPIRPIRKRGDCVEIDFPTMTGDVRVLRTGDYLVITNPPGVHHFTFTEDEYRCLFNGSSTTDGNS